MVVVLIVVRGRIRDELGSRGRSYSSFLGDSRRGFCYSGSSVGGTCGYVLDVL